MMRDPSVKVHEDQESGAATGDTKPPPPKATVTSVRGKHAWWYLCAICVQGMRQG